MKLKNIENNELNYKTYKKFFKNKNFIIKKVSKYNYFSILASIFLSSYYKNEMDSYNVYLEILKFEDFKKFIIEFKKKKSNNIGDVLESLYFSINNFNLLKNINLHEKDYNAILSKISYANNLILIFLKNMYPQNFDFFFKKILLILYSL